MEGRELPEYNILNKIRMFDYTDRGINIIPGGISYGVW